MALRITMVPPELVLRIANQGPGDRGPRDLGTGDPGTGDLRDLYKDGPLCPRKRREKRERARKRKKRENGGVGSGRDKTLKTSAR